MNAASSAASWYTVSAAGSKESDEEKKKKKVYIVKLDWSTEDGNDTELTVYGTYDKAYAKFKELIADEMNPENSWVGELEWKDGIPADDKIELDFLDRRNDTDETECYWLITDTWNFGTHTYISIEIKEVL